MALDKSRTSPLMKTGIIMLIATFVIGIGGFGALATCSATQSGTPTATQPGSATTTQSVEAIGLKYTPQIQAREASITASPKDYELLKAQGITYYDWALEVRQATAQTPGQDKPIWQAAATYYKRALDVKSGDPQVMGDHAVALFYSEDTTAAIAAGEKLRAQSPTFGPNLFNLGIFYEAAGDTAKAKAAYEAYLKVEPNGQTSQAAKDALARLK